MTTFLVIAAINVQDKDRCIVISADDNKDTLTEDAITTLFQGNSTNHRGDDE